MTKNANQTSTAALVLAFDSSMFQQAQRCIETIREHCRRPYHLYAVGIDLKGPERDWVRGEGIGLLEDLASVPRYADGPPYATAMTCRPYLPQLFPGHGLYLSIDPDIRFQHPDAFEFYLAGAELRPKGIVICQEADTIYPILRQAKKANHYFGTRYHRIAKVFGQDVATHMQFFLGFNAGLFAMTAQSPAWNHYAKRIEQTVKFPFTHLGEQDAMNVAITEDDLELVVAPTIMNWLCMNSMPAYDPTSKRFVRPEYPFLPISAVHLNNSTAIVPGEPDGTTQYEIYRRAGLTK